MKTDTITIRDKHRLDENLGRLTSSGTGSDVGEQLLDVLSLESLGEESGPDGLKLNLGGGGESDELLGGDLNTLVGEDKSGVRGGEFRL